MTTATASAPHAAPSSVPTATRGGAPKGARLLRWLDILGLTWLTPLVSIAYGEPVKYHLLRLTRMVGLPAIMIVLVLASWSVIAAKVQLGNLNIPGPGVVYGRGVEMCHDWTAERARQAAFAAETDVMVKEMLASERVSNPGLTPAAAVTLEQEVREYRQDTSKLTFIDQALLSLRTVFVGVLCAVLIAIPVGVMCGLSGWIYEMCNPVIQILKPVSPVAWFAVIYIFVNQWMNNPEPGSAFPKSFIMAAIVVCMCAIWPTLLNTANGVANVDKDFLNVAKVLNLGWFSKIFRIVIPASLPQIFTGIRLSFGVGWMVLIAAEMMAVSPGLGGFVWDWYQSSNETSLSYLMLAVLVIGGIGFVLDRLMITVQKLVTPGATLTVR